MRDCCRYYSDALAILAELRKVVPVHLVRWVDYLIQFTQDAWDSHTDNAVEDR